MPAAHGYTVLRLYGSPSDFTEDFPELRVEWANIPNSRTPNSFDAVA